MSAKKLSDMVAMPKNVSRGGIFSGNSESIVEVSISRIMDNPMQPRLNMDAGELEKLQSSIEAHGLLQPVVIRELGGGRLELVAGHRRVAAHKNLGRETIKAIVKKDIDDDLSRVFVGIENIHREDLNPIELGMYIKGFMVDTKKSRAEIMNILNMSESKLSRVLALSEIGDEVYAISKKNNYTNIKVLAALLKLPEELQPGILARIINESLNTEDALSLIEDSGNKKRAGKGVVYVKSKIANIEEKGGKLLMKINASGLNESQKAMVNTLIESLKGEK